MKLKVPRRLAVAASAVSLSVLCAATGYLVGVPRAQAAVIVHEPDLYPISWDIYYQISRALLDSYGAQSVRLTRWR